MYERTRTEGWNQLFTTGMAIDGDEAWFANNILNGLYHIDLRTEEIRFITTIPNEKVRAPFLYSSCYLWKDNVVLIPANADNLAVYNKRTQEIFQYEIVDNKGEIIRGFFSSWQRDNHIYFISLRKPIIARFDVDTQQINVYSEWDNAIRNRDCRYTELFWGEVLVEGNFIYIPCQSMNCICMVDLEQKKSEMIEIDADITGIYTICRCREKYYISSSGGGVFELNFNPEKVTSKQVCSIPGGFCRSIVIGDDIYFFPKAARNIYKYSIWRKQMEPCFAEYLHIENEWRPVAKSFYYYNESYYQMVEKIDDDVWIFMLSDGCLYLLSNGNIKKKGELFCRPNEKPLCVLDGSGSELEMYKEFCDKGNILRNSLSAFLQILDNRKGQPKLQEQTIIGEKIYEGITGWRI